MQALRMPDDEPLCSKCRKPLVRAGQATLTQWIVQQDKCACDVVGSGVSQAQAPDSPAKPILVCRTCSKRIEDARKGSLTQWIFESHLCTCKVPVPVETDSYAAPDRGALPPGVNLDTTTSPEDVELKLSEADFPVDRYAPLQQLGSGASGTVYLCRDRLLGIKVAIKILHRLNSEQLMQFQQEARVIAKMDHHSIVRLLDFGPTINGTPYMVLEYFRGKSLEETLATQTLTLRQLVKVFSRIAQGLSHAHEHSILHRDLKPSNVLLSITSPNNPDVKIIDFGLSRLETAEQQSSTLAGTPQFMSPDVLQGLTYDATSEVYALGCMMYYALTGYPPFVGGTALETMSMHAHAPVPELPADAMPFPDELKQVVRTCLAKQKEQRYQSADEFEQALKTIPLVDSKPATPEPKPSARTTAQSSFSSKPSISTKPGGKLIAIVAVALLFVASTVGGIMFIVGEKHKVSSEQVQEQKSELAVLEKHTSAVDQLLARAKNGDSATQAEVGDMYYYGRSITKDFPKALHWYETAAKSGMYECYNKAAWMHENGEGTKPDVPKALDLYRTAAKHGSTDALRNLTRLLAFEFRKTTNNKTKNTQLRKERIDALQKLSDIGDGNAQYWLAQEYTQGTTVPKDAARAEELLRQSARNGSRQASSILGMKALSKAKNSTGKARAAAEAEAQQYLKNVDTSNPMTKLTMLAFSGKTHMKMVGPVAEKEFMKSAKQGNTFGMVRLADCYLDNASRAERPSATAQDKAAGKDGYAKAVTWYKKAAAKDDPIAQNNLGFMYDRGLGVKRDEKKAFELFKAAAEAPINAPADPYAMINLGLSYELGRGTKVDYKEAAKWYYEAAEAKLPEAEYRLSTMYKRGLGVAADEQQASAWLKKAAFRKHQQACKILYGTKAPPDSTCSHYNAFFALVADDGK